MPRAAAAALAVALFSISWAAVLYRLSGVPGGEAAWWRLLIGVAFTLAACWASGCRGPPGARYAAAAGALLALHFVSWFESLRRVSVAVSTAIVVTYPVFILWLEWAFEGLRPTGARVAGVVLALAGVAVLARPWEAGGVELAGAALALLGSAAGAGYFYLGRLARRRGAATLPYTLAAYTASLAVVTGFLAASGGDPLGVPRGSLPYLAALGLVPMIGGHTMLNYSLRYYPASTVTTLTLLEPFGAALLAWLVLGEEPPPEAVPGAALAVAGSALVTLSEPGLGEGGRARGEEAPGDGGAQEALRGGG